jgi:hypothetical protein
MLAVLAAAAQKGIYNVRYVSFYVGAYYVLVAHGLMRLRPALRIATLCFS